MKHIKAMTALALMGCAGMDPTDKSQDWSPPERTMEEAGMDGDSMIANGVVTPTAPDGFLKKWKYASGLTVIPQPKSIGARNSIIKSEALGCTEDGVCGFETRHFWPDMTELTADELFENGFGDGQGFGVDGAPPNFWDDGGEAAVAIEKATCQGPNDACNTCFQPDCYGGGRDPGGNLQPQTGCSGSKIQYGGPGCDRPDNANVTISFWDGFDYSCNDTEFEDMPAMKWVIDSLNANNRILPPPFELVKTGCGVGGLPRGYKKIVGPDGADAITPGEPTVQGTLVDIHAFYANLGGDAPYLDYYCPYLNRRPGGNYAWARLIGCTWQEYEKNADGTSAYREWNNGYTTQRYRTLRGTFLTVDPQAVEWLANHPGMDKGGLNESTRLWYIMIHTIAHEIGHSIGLQHAFNGEENTDRWIPHNHRTGSKIQNPNKVPYSVMVSNVPAAPYTLLGWSSGLAANLQNYDTPSAGDRNAEAWRLANQLGVVYDSGGTAVAKNTFSPPLTAANNEK